MTTMRYAFAVLLVLLGPAVAEAAKKEPRSGQLPCRQGALGLIHYLDRDEEGTAEYAHAYGMVETCGPVRTAKAKAAPVQPVSDRAFCRDLALKMLDELEENRMNRPSFVKARDEFAEKCGPAKGVEPKAPRVD